MGFFGKVFAAPFYVFGAACFIVNPASAIVMGIPSLYAASKISSIGDSRVVTSSRTISSSTSTYSNSIATTSYKPTLIHNKGQVTKIMIKSAMCGDCGYLGSKQYLIWMTGRGYCCQRCTSLDYNYIKQGNSTYKSSPAKYESSPVKYESSPVLKSTTCNECGNLGQRQYLIWMTGRGFCCSSCSKIPEEEMY